MSSIYKSHLVSGFSSTIISPKSQIELGGFGYYLKRINTGILDDIFTKALYISTKDNAVLLISNDLIGLTSKSASSIAREISSKTEIPKENIIISCTHTHSAPATAELEGCGKIDNRYMQWLKTKIVKNAIKATTNPSQTKIAFKKFKIESFSFNKSLPQKTKKKQDVLLLSFETPKNEILLTQFSTHPVVLGNQFTVISKDFLRAFYSFANENNFDKIIFFTGACGEILPDIVRKKASTKSSGDSFISKILFKQENETLKKKLLKQYKTGRWEKIIPDHIKVITRDIVLKFKIPSYYKDTEKMKHYFESIFYDRVDLNKGLIRAVEEKKDPNVRKKEERAKGVQKIISTRFYQYKRQLKNKGIEFSSKIRSTIIQLGDVIIVALPFEVTNKLETTLRSLYPKLFLFCYTNGLEGYVYDPDESTSYPRTRGSLLYNLFPFEKTSYNKLLSKIKKILKFNL